MKKMLKRWWCFWVHDVTHDYKFIKSEDTWTSIAHINTYECLRCGSLQRLKFSKRIWGG